MNTHAELDNLALFALQSSHALGEGVARCLGVDLSPHEERDFEDGEHKARPLTGVSDMDVYVILSLHGDAAASVNDKLVRLLLFVGALRDAGAARLTTIVPYLCYARKDRRTQPRDPVSTRYVAQLFEAVGVDRVAVVDVHNRAAFDNAFRIPAEHIAAAPLFIDHLQRELPADRPLVVVSPDAGGVKRAERLRERLSAALDREIELAFLEKKRSGGRISGKGMAGQVDGRHAVIIDDIISSGGTLVRAARACRARGAIAVDALATHGVFGRGAAQSLSDAALERIVITNTVPLARGSSPVNDDKLVVLDVAPALADAIERLHLGDSPLDPTP